MAVGKAFEEVPVGSREEWRDWLSRCHGQADSIWLVYRKTSRGGLLTVEEAIEEAIAWGWIDSLVRRKDEDHAMLLFSPRKATSNWSAVNKARVEKILASGLMQPSGQRKIDEAKTSGRWDALNDVEAMMVPDDLARAFATREPALANFEAFPRSVKRAILEWILNAKSAETRERRVKETAELAMVNQRANQWKPKV